MPKTIQVTKILGQQKRVMPRAIGNEDSITIDNDVFDDAHDFIIDKRNIEKLLFTIQNSGLVSSLDFEIFSTITPDSTPPPFTLVDWNPLNGGIGSVSKETNETFSSSMVFTWLLIRLKRSQLGNNTIAKIKINSGVNN